MRCPPASASSETWELVGHIDEEHWVFVVALLLQVPFLPHVYVFIIGVCWRCLHDLKFSHNCFAVSLRANQERKEAVGSREMGPPNPTATILVNVFLIFLRSCPVGPHTTNRRLPPHFLLGQQSFLLCHLCLFLSPFLSLFSFLRRAPSHAMIHANQARTRSHQVTNSK